MKHYLQRHDWGRMVWNIIFAVLLSWGIYETYQVHDLSQSNSVLIHQTRTQGANFVQEQRRVDQLFARTLKGGCSQSNSAKEVVANLVRSVLVLAKSAPLRDGQTDEDRAAAVEFYQDQLDKIQSTLVNCKKYATIARRAQQK